MAKGKYEEWLEPDGLLKIEGWARDGLTDKQIAENIGISERSFTDWKSKYPSISSVLKKSKEVVDRIVENALYERALGGTHEVVRRRIAIGCNSELNSRLKPIRLRGYACNRRILPVRPHTLVVLFEDKKSLF